MILIEMILKILHAKQSLMKITLYPTNNLAVMDGTNKHVFRLHNSCFKAYYKHRVTNSCAVLFCFSFKESIYNIYFCLNDTF